MNLHFDDLTAITCPFGLLDADTQQRLRDCGGPWETVDTDGWKNWLNPSWAEFRTYRKKLEPPKPLEYWRIQHSDGWIALDTYNSAEEAEKYLADFAAGSRIIHMREVTP